MTDLKINYNKSDNACEHYLTFVHQIGYISRIGYFVLKKLTQNHKNTEMYRLVTIQTFVLSCWF